MKTLKVDAVYPMAHETFAAVAQDLPRFIEVAGRLERLGGGGRRKRADFLRPSPPLPLTWALRVRRTKSNSSRNPKGLGR